LPHLCRYARPALALGLACAFAIAARPASAAPACDAGFLALEEGVVWSYERAVPEGEDEAAGQGGELKLELPTELSIEVTSVATEGDETVIELKESYGDIEQATTIRCEDDEIEVSPHSFLASGEPGGGIGIALEETDRDGASYPTALRPAQRWNEWIEASFAQTSAEGSGAAHPAGKIQVERKMRVLRRVRMEIGEASYRPYRVDFTLSGRAMVEPEIELGVEIPADAAGALWFEPGVGLVRAVNRFGHSWSLSERTGAE
jgi:hypothetical protein